MRVDPSFNCTNVDLSHETLRVSKPIRADGSLIAGEYLTKLNGFDISYKISGTGPVIFMTTPGWGVSSEIYSNSLKSLEADFTMVYIESRGSGRSESPTEEQAFKAEYMAADCEALRSYLEQDQIILVGHSAGALIALEYALKYPDNLQQLVLLCGFTGWSKEHSADVKKQVAKRINEPLIKEALAAFGQVGAIKTDAEFKDLITQAFAIYLYDSKHVADFLQKNKSVFEPTSFSIATHKAFTKVNKGSYQGQLKDTEVPTLTFAGRKDIVCSVEQSELLHSGIPNSKLFIFEQSAHMPWLEEPDLFLKLIKQELAVSH